MKDIQTIELWPSTINNLHPNNSGHLELHSHKLLQHRINEGVNSSSIFNEGNEFLKFALRAKHFGFQVIPVCPGTKRTAVKWDGWCTNCSDQKLVDYWKQRPNHELGMIAGEDIIVFDADSSASINALKQIEIDFDIQPNFIINTSKGVHHYFKRAANSIAQSDGHCTSLYPHRIDIKTGRALVILAPSTGKTVGLIAAKSVNDLVEVGQDFIDAINLHNGRNLPTASNQLQTSKIIKRPSTDGYLGLTALLNQLDPGCGYQDWFRILAAIFHHTGGSDDGFAIANAWSSTSIKYKGEKEILAKWHSLDLDHPHAITIGSLIKMVDNGYAIFHAADEPFGVVLSESTGAK